MYPKLDKHTEKQLITLGKWRICKTIILTVAWMLAVIVLWYLYLTKFERPITHPTCFIFPLLMVLPFYPFHVQRIIFGKTFYGRVMSTRYRTKRKLIQLSISDMRNGEYETADVVFVGRDGENVKINYKQRSVLEDNIYYKPDDYIFFVHGLSFPVKYPIPEDATYLCPVCGNYIYAGRRRCGWCKANLK